MVVALNRQDKMLFMNATEKLGQGKEKIDQFSSELKSLCIYTILNLSDTYEAMQNISNCDYYKY